MPKLPELELFEALTQLLARVYQFGNLDTVRDEGPIEDAGNAVANYKTRHNI